MDITVRLLRLICIALIDESQKYELGNDESDVFIDAADALADAADLLDDLNG